LVAGDENTTSIPVPLRETAAWLVALDPVHTRWLADADPTSLAGHSAVVDSEDIRRLVVDSLLRHASETELGDAAWMRTRWQLAHPGLAGQLAPVLNEAAAGQPEEWSVHARIRLAARLAQDASAPELAGPLLSLAEHDGWDAYTRKIAARAAFNAVPVEAASRLRALLVRFADEAYAGAADPDDELRAALLDLLWPQHLPLAEVLVQLRPRRNRNLVGGYLMFLRSMPSRVADSELIQLLTWLRAGVAADAGSASSDEEEPAVGGADPMAVESSARPAGALTANRPDPYLIQAVVDRSLSGDNAAHRVDDVAAVLWAGLSRHRDDVELPAPVDIVDLDGDEPAQVCRLRRALARALARVAAQHGDSDPGAVWPIVRGWHRRVPWPYEEETAGQLRPAHRRGLVDAEDFSWALAASEEAAAAGDDHLAEALGSLAYLVFDPTSPGTVELAYSRQDSPAWKYLRSAFDPVRLDSDYARMMHNRASSARNDPSVPWQQADLLANQLTVLLGRAASGDTDAFWQLLWNLQVDPATGYRREWQSDACSRFQACPCLATRQRSSFWKRHPDTSMPNTTTPPPGWAPIGTTGGPGPATSRSSPWTRPAAWTNYQPGYGAHGPAPSSGSRPPSPTASASRSCSTEQRTPPANSPTQSGAWFAATLPVASGRSR